MCCLPASRASFIHERYTSAVEAVVAEQRARGVTPVIVTADEGGYLAVLAAKALCAAEEAGATSGGGEGGAGTTATGGGAERGE